MTPGDVRLHLRRSLTPAHLVQLLYVPLLGSAMALMLLRTLLLARILDVDGFAKISGALLVSGTFCMLNCLGLLPLLQRELPIRLVRRRENAGHVLLAQCVMVALGLAILGVAAAFAGVSAAGLTPSLFGVAILHGCSQEVFLVATVESRSRGQPLQFARQNFIRSITMLTLGCIIAFVTRSAIWTLATEATVGFLLTEQALRMVWARSALPTSAIYRLAFNRLGRLSWSSAISLMVVTIVSFLVFNADRWIAAQFLGPTIFAQYAFAWTVLLVAQAMQAVINTSIYPLLARRFASKGTDAAFRVCTIASLGLLLAGGVLGVPAYWLFDMAIARFFPAYGGARTLLPVFLAIAVLRLADFWSTYLIITRNERTLIFINVVAAVIAVSAWFISRAFSSHVLDLRGVAALAALLTVSAYAGSALCALRVARACED
jgi:O-antigen/teichoic acid export membrane protein